MSQSAAYEATPDRFLRRREVEDLVGYSKNTIYRAIKDRGFPAPYSVGGASSRWSLREVTAWMDRVKGVIPNR